MSEVIAARERILDRIHADPHGELEAYAENDMADIFNLAYKLTAHPARSKEYIAAMTALEDTFDRLKRQCVERNLESEIDAVREDIRLSAEDEGYEQRVA